MKFHVDFFFLFFFFIFVFLFWFCVREDHVLNSRDERARTFDFMEIEPLAYEWPLIFLVLFSFLSFLACQKWNDLFIETSRITIISQCIPFFFLNLWSIILPLKEMREDERKKRREDMREENVTDKRVIFVSKAYSVDVTHTHLWLRVDLLLQLRSVSHHHHHRYVR